MASKNEYVLTIDINGGMQTENPIANNTEQSTIKHTKYEGAIFTAYMVAQPFVQKTEQIIMNNLNTQYANEEYQMKAQFFLDLANKGAGIVAGIAGGQSLASALGIASSMGAVIGGVIAVAGIAMDIAVKQNALNNAKIVEDEGLQILRGRAGIQFNRSRSGQ